MCRETLLACEEKLRAAKAGVQAINLQIVGAKVLSAMKDGETDKRKSYHAVCWASRALTVDNVARISAMTDIELTQGLPGRVLHRRAPLVQQRVRPPYCPRTSSI